MMMMLEFSVFVNESIQAQLLINSIASCNLAQVAVKTLVILYLSMEIFGSFCKINDFFHHIHIASLIEFWNPYWAFWF